MAQRYNSRWVLSLFPLEDTFFLLRTYCLLRRVRFKHLPKNIVEKEKPSWEREKQKTNYHRNIKIGKDLQDHLVQPSHMLPNHTAPVTGGKFWPGHVLTTQVKAPSTKRTVSHVYTHRFNAWLVLREAPFVLHLLIALNAGTCSESVPVESCRSWAFTVWVCPETTCWA